jgi:putative RecB family exonuclease
VNFKSTSTTPHEQLLLHRNERHLGCYALLYRSAPGSREKGFELHHSVKTKTPKLGVTQYRPRTGVQESKLLRSIDSFVHGVERADWVPSPGLQCSSCEDFNECRSAL